jgi:hypothetical protein
MLHGVSETNPPTFQGVSPPQAAQRMTHPTDSVHGRTVTTGSKGLGGHRKRL